MNQLRELLASKESEAGEGSQKLDKLESLFERLQEMEIPIEQCARATLQDPLLLLFA
jgi:hypothetical protein